MVGFRVTLRIRVSVGFRVTLRIRVRLDLSLRYGSGLDLGTG